MWRVRKVVKAKSNYYGDVDAYYKFYLPFFVVRLLILILQFMEGLFCFQDTSLWNDSYKFSETFPALYNLLWQKDVIFGGILSVFLVDLGTFLSQCSYYSTNWFLCVVNWPFQTVLFEEILAVIVSFLLFPIYGGICHKSLFEYIKFCPSLKKWMDKIFEFPSFSCISS